MLRGQAAVGDGGPMVLHVRATALTGVVGVLALVLAGCSAGGGETTADAPSPTKTRAGTPGRAACDLSTGTGSVSLRETADSYRVEWTGVPEDEADNRTDYEVQLGNTSMKHGVTLFMEFDDVLGTTIGLLPQGSVDVQPIDGAPQVSGDRVVGTFPKDPDLVPSWWSPEHTVIDDDGATSTTCTDDGQVIDYTPLG